MDWSVARRHELICLLETELGTPPRFEALARAAGLPSPPLQGVEPPFARLSRLVRAAADAERLDELAEAAKGLVSPPMVARFDELLVDPGAETMWSEPETVRAEPGDSAETDATIVTGEEDETIVDGAPAPTAAAGATSLPAPDPPRWAVPRPPGTPAQAAPTEGAESFLVRRVNLSLPAQVDPGQALSMRLVASAAAPGSVATAPADAVPFVGSPVKVEVELWLEDARPAEEAGDRAVLEVDPSAPKVETTFELVAADPLSEGVDVTARFFLAGYEVGRARAFVPNRGRTGEEQRSGAPGALVIPDTILPTG